MNGIVAASATQNEADLPSSIGKNMNRVSSRKLTTLRTCRIQTLTAIMGCVIGRAVAVVKPGGALEIRPVAGVVPVLAAVDNVWAMACSRAGDMPTVLLSALDEVDVCTCSIGTACTHHMDMDVYSLV